MKVNPTEEQRKVLENQKKNLIVSASAGSGKTFVVIEYLIQLICEKKIPLSKFLVLTFTKAAANEMKTRLYNAILKEKPTPFLLEQIDEISQSDISTIDAFCERLIKRNINKLSLDENFTIMDEKSSKALKFAAFERAYEEFCESDADSFNVIYFAFKKNKDIVYDCMLDMQNFFDSNFEGDELVDEFLSKNEDFKKQGEKYLVDYILNIMKSQEKILNSLHDLPEKYEAVRQQLLCFCGQKYEGNFIDFFNRLDNVFIQKFPTAKIEDVQQRAILSDCKDTINKTSKIIDKYAGLTNDEYAKYNVNDLPTALLRLYKCFSKNYDILKTSRTALDFADLEKIAKTLLQDDEIIKSLQEKYDYIFIDEYQDTNFLQEAIIKPIAQRGNFIAVGDPKQGIYGFRNASMEIMKKDIEEFSNKEASDALFLKGNFRSDKRVLDFINKIFIKIMTKDSVGIDYEKTSLLEGLQNFEEGKMLSVSVDIIKEEKDEEKPTGIYSVKDDQLTLSKKNNIEVWDIARRVEQAMMSQIYDAKNKKFRKVQPSDIAILFRGRNGVMPEAVKFLQEKGFNVVADIKQNLLEDSEIRVLISLLKITYDFNDDISLAAVMNSWFGGFSLDGLLLIAKSDKDKKFYQIVKDSDNEKILGFERDVENFYFDCQVMGLTKALGKLFAQKEFYLHINNLPSSGIKKSHINEFFKLIKSGNFDYDIPSLIDYIENNEVGGQINEQSADAITMTTIHATKGLEYPIVILCGGGESLTKSSPKQYALSKDFGLATMLYDFDDGEKIPSASFISSGIKKLKKEFIEEIMIFYVALTRAQNHLIIIGSKDEKNIKITDDVFVCQSYIDMIFSVYGKDFAHKLFTEGYIKAGDVEFNLIDKVDDIKNARVEKTKSFSKILQESNGIKEYIDFVYPGKNECRYEYKNSVSGVLHLDDEKEFVAAGGGNREEAILRGNAYHEALKLLDFEKINSLEDLQNQKEYLLSKMTDGYVPLLNFDILWKNISLIKDIVKDQKVIKEKEFIMETSLEEAGITDSKQSVIVQGVVDLFTMGDKIILIDYKFTSERDDDELIKRYKKQIHLYSLAIEKAFNKKVDKKYLLSLKHAKLIEIKE